MFVSESYVPKFEWQRDATAKAETWTTITRMPPIRGTVTRQNPELGEQWLASLMIDGETHPLYPKPTRLEAQAAAEGAMVALDWTAPELAGCDDLPEPPAGTVAAAVNWGDADDRRLDVLPIQVRDTALVELRAGGTRYVIDEHQLHRMLTRIQGARGNRLDPVTGRFLRKASGALEGGASFVTADEDAAP